jgi:hypothetical protein
VVFGVLRKASVRVVEAQIPTIFSAILKTYLLRTPLFEEIVPTGLIFLLIPVVDVVTLSPIEIIIILRLNWETVSRPPLLSYDDVHFLLGLPPCKRTEGPFGPQIVHILLDLLETSLIQG